MNEVLFQKIIIDAFVSLDVKPLNLIPDTTELRFDVLSKKDLIFELVLVFEDIKSIGINNLYFKKSKCNYCFQLLDTFEFHSLDEKFSINYIIS